MKDRQEVIIWITIAIIIAAVYNYNVINETSTTLAVAFIITVRGFIYKSDQVKQRNETIQLLETRKKELETENISLRKNR